MRDEILIGLIVALGACTVGLWLLYRTWLRAARVHRMLCSALTYRPTLASVRAWSRKELAEAEAWVRSERGTGKRHDMPFCVVALGYQHALSRGFTAPEQADEDEVPIPSRTRVIGDQRGVRAYG